MTAARFGTHVVLSGGVLIACLGVCARAPAQQRCAATFKTNKDHRVVGGERALRSATAKALACEWEQADRDYERIARLTDTYVRLSNTPACQLLLANAQAHVDLARALAAKGVLEPSERKRQGRHWRTAWEVLSGISMAWDSEVVPGTSDPNDAGRDTCVQPARDLLGRFPSVTITVNPEEATGYQLAWNGATRVGSLPRMLPGMHRLRIDPPNGHAVTTLTVDGGAARRHVGSFEHHLALGWMQRMRIDLTFHTEEQHDPDPDCQTHECRPIAEAPPSRNWLLWSGGGAFAVGAAGLVGSALHANSLWAQGESLYLSNPEACQTNASPRSCPGDDKYDAGDRWGAWGVGGFGALAGVGVVGVALYFLLPDDPELNSVAPSLGAGFAGLTVSGSY